MRPSRYTVPAMAAGVGYCIQPKQAGCTKLVAACLVVYRGCVVMHNTGGDGGLDVPTLAPDMNSMA